MAPACQERQSQKYIKSNPSHPVVGTVARAYQYSTILSFGLAFGPVLECTATIGESVSFGSQQ